MSQSRARLPRRAIRVRALFLSACLAFTLAWQADAEGDAATAAAIEKHFAQKVEPAPMPGAEAAGVIEKANDPASSPEAMVSYFTQEQPEDVTVAARRRHVDLDIKFEFDSADLSEGGIEQLDTAGQALVDPQLASRRFMLGGHTDDLGDADYNRELSRRRAESAKTYLIEVHKIAPDRLETVGFGSDHPKDPSSTPEARQSNRRVVLELIE
jgi:outer membrane protein OmpA-like peptidoglycan-associated protein